MSFSRYVPTQRPSLRPAVHHDVRRRLNTPCMSDNLYKEHWLDIDSERFERYKTMFQWSPLTESLISPANIRAGHVVVDVGCGPGFVAVELARRVGAHGHVHAIDINRDFVEHADLTWLHGRRPGEESGA